MTDRSIGIDSDQDEHWICTYTMDGIYLSLAASAVRPISPCTLAYRYSPIEWLATSSMVVVVSFTSLSLACKSTVVPTRTSEFWSNEQASNARINFEGRKGAAGWSQLDRVVHYSFIASRTDYVHIQNWTQKRRPATYIIARDWTFDFVAIFKPLVHDK
jgi:hypothetical protein